MNQLDGLETNLRPSPCLAWRGLAKVVFSADREAWRRSLNDSELNAADSKPEATRLSRRCFLLAGSQCLPVDLWSPRGGAKFSYAVCSRESGFC